MFRFAPMRVGLTFVAVGVALAATACSSVPPTSTASLVVPSPTRSPIASVTAVPATPSMTQEGTPSARPPASATSTPVPGLADAVIPDATALKPQEKYTTDFPQGLLAAFDSLWTANEHLDTVTRIDPNTGRIIAIHVTPGLGPQSMAETDTAIWVAGGGGIDRINSATNGIDAHFDGRFGSLLFAFGSLWAGEARGVLRLNPETGTKIAEPQVSDADQCKVTVADDSIWLGCDEDLLRLDPTTDAVIASIKEAGPLGLVVSGDGGSWLATGLDPFGAASMDLTYTRLDRLDTDSNELVPGSGTRLVHGASAVGMLSNGADIWFSTSAGAPPGGMLYRFDTSIGQVTAAFDISEGIGCGSQALAFAYDSLWTASPPCNDVRRFAGFMP
jgi:hypothetical protein